MVLVVVCLWGTGIIQGNKFSVRIKKVETYLQLLFFVSSEIKYSHAPIKNILQLACTTESLSQAGFLQPCLNALQNGESLSQAWKKGVSNDAQGLKEREIQALSNLGDFLGCSDVENQLQLLSQKIQVLQECLDEAKEEKKKKARLYANLGLLSGLTIVILLW